MHVKLELWWIAWFAFSRRRIFVDFISPCANIRCPCLSCVGERLASSSAPVRSLQAHSIFVAQVRWAGGREACAHLDVCLECRGHDVSRSVRGSRHVRLHVVDYLCSTLLLRCFSDFARCGMFGVPLYWAFVFRCVLASLWQGFRSPFRGVCSSCAQRGVRLNNVCVGLFEVNFVSLFVVPFSTFLFIAGGD